jgi:hypothetical protein
MAPNPHLGKAIALAATRIGLATALIYADVGAIIFPQWWKEFLLTGGIFKLHVWRDGANYLSTQIGLFSPLGVFLVGCFVFIIGYTTFWFGRHLSESQKSKVAFLQGLPPSRTSVIVLGCISFVLLFVACLQPGSYAQNKYQELVNNILVEKLKQLGNWGQSPYSPPETGVYLYLDEKLIIKQFQALQSDMEPKERTESIGKEQDTSVSASLPINGVKLEAGTKLSTEQSMTLNTPDITPGFAAGRIIKRFIADTNTITWALFHPIVVSSDFVTTMVSNAGVQLSSDQKAQLKRHDRVQYESNIAKIVPHKIILYNGTIRLLKSSGRLVVEFSDSGPVTVVAKGYVNKEFLADSMLFSFEGNQESRDLAGVSVLAIVEDTHRDGDGNLQISITPECIW